MMHLTLYICFCTALHAIEQVTVLALVAMWFRGLMEEVEGVPESHTKFVLHEALQRLPISFGMGLRSRPRCQEIAAVSRVKK